MANKKTREGTIQHKDTTQQSSSRRRRKANKVMSYPRIGVVIAILLVVIGIETFTLVFHGKMTLQLSSSPSSYNNNDHHHDSDHLTTPYYKKKKNSEEDVPPDPVIIRPLTNHQHDPEDPFLIRTTTTTITGGGDKREITCECDLLSIDCLNSVRCLPDLYAADPTPASAVPGAPDDNINNVIIGVLTRRAMKESVSKYQGSGHGYSLDPVGKSIQYSTIDAWGSWIKKNRLPPGYNKGDSSPFIDESKYSDCVRNKWSGKACYFTDTNAEETDNYDGCYDKKQVKAINQALELNDDVDGAKSNYMDYKQMYEYIKNDVFAFREQLMSEKKKESSSSSTTNKVNTMGQLLSFAHTMRIRFNIRSHMLRDVYEQRLESVIHVNSTTTKRFPVSLHLRRADACDHKEHGYETNASPIDSPAQVTGKRKCYATSVYINALTRLQTELNQIVRGGGDDDNDDDSAAVVLDVYLSTDHAGSVLDDIKTKFSDTYQQMNWHYLTYYEDGSIFQYKGMIESSRNAKKQAMLGESAVADLFHLSHGRAFIGHLGSRFGKVSWLLMTARQNALVPYFTVDGHSYCCEIDETCSEAKPYIVDMENCMTFAHALSGVTQSRKPGEGYWDIGSTKRKIFILQEQAKKNREGKKKKGMKRRKEKERKKRKKDRKR